MKSTSGFSIPGSGAERWTDARFAACVSTGSFSLRFRRPRRLGSPFVDGSGAAAGARLGSALGWVLGWAFGSATGGAGGGTVAAGFGAGFGFGGAFAAGLGGA